MKITKESVSNLLHEYTGEFHDIFAMFYKMTDDWYERLDKLHAFPQYSFPVADYSSKEYLWVAAECFYNVSCDYVDLISDRVVGNRIIDYGAGLGLTTAMLKQQFPDRTIMYSNLSGSQSEFAKWLFDRLDLEIDIIENQSVPDCDTLVAIELFEHFRNPSKEFDNIIGRLYPWEIVLSTPFKFRAHGHFPYYWIDQTLYRNDAAEEKFKQALRNRGWTETSDFLHGRPSIWRNA